MEALDAGGTSEVELEELRHEKELQKEEIQKLQAQIQSLRSEIQVHKVIKCYDVSTHTLYVTLCTSLSYSGGETHF